MPNPERTWQLTSLALAVVLVGALFGLYSSGPARSVTTDTLTTVNSATNLEHLALSPNARRIHERYSL
ncbi:hypothetical protein [Pseudomonas sp. A2]|uniref:hypothetical protein n=1 Tax=Pseudomonas sp. A2 TaxID=107445 RepID=UPI001FFF76CA|nr:hypothetical protein [Pseudomonas sp. A2]UPK85314.1 hypothetical protein E5221_10125 [Pseudomonas sp. A2]